MTKDPKPKYLQLKWITGRALMDDGACRKELGAFIIRYGVDECATAGFRHSVDEYAAQVKPGNLAWLIDHGYLQRVEPEQPQRTYHKGQDVLIIGGSGNRYKICHVGRGLVSLVSWADGNCWADPPIRVDNSDKIPKSVVDKLANYREWTLVE